VAVLKRLSADLLPMFSRWGKSWGEGGRQPGKAWRQAECLEGRARFSKGVKGGAAEKDLTAIVNGLRKTEIPQNPTGQRQEWDKEKK